MKTKNRTAKNTEKNTDQRIRRLHIGLAVCVLCLIGLLAYLFIFNDGRRSGDAAAGLNAFGKNRSGADDAGNRSAFSANFSDPKEAYENKEYGFSLKLPEGFKPRESKMGDTSTIVLENEKAEGIQIMISPFDENELAVDGGKKAVTKDMILRDIPDMQIREEQPIEIGDNYMGLAFKSDNESFDGSSREVWFVFKGHLYQVSTYEKFDDLLKAMFVTWQFD